MRGNDAGWLSPLVLMLLPGAVASFVLFIAVERRTPSPLVDLSVFRSRQLTGATIVGLLSTAAMCSVMFFVSLYLQVSAGYSTLGAGVVFLPMTLIVVAMAPLAGWLTRKVGPRTLLVGGMTLLAAAMVLLSRLDRGLGVTGIAGGLALAGFGVALTATPVTATSLDALPESQRGLGSAIVNVSRSVGLAMGVAVMGTIVVSTTQGRYPPGCRRGFSSTRASPSPQRRSDSPCVASLNRRAGLTPSPSMDPSLERTSPRSPRTAAHQASQRFREGQTRG